MQELRLVPPALAVWAAALTVLVVGVAPAAALVVTAGLACAALRQYGQAILVAGLGAASWAAATVRLALAERFDPPGSVRGTVSSAPVPLADGGFLVRVSVPGHPGPIPVFTRGLPDGAVPGAVVDAIGTVGEAGRPGTTRITLSGQVQVEEPPRGMAAVAGHVRETLTSAAAAHLGEGPRGLVPGLVLGDTSLQTPAQQQAYVDTGLSHLSAVSGSNVAIVTTAAVLVASTLGCGLRARIVCAGVALMTYACLVGAEPSVLRASVTGLVSLVAVLSSRISEPVHALCLAVVALVIVDTNLAVSYGFALSVAATAGIVVLSPLLYRALAVLRWPEILTRALAVAVAADVVTMPLIALMTGRVSLVAVVANVLVAPCVGPITVLGLVATVLALLPGGAEAPLLWVVEPLAWWVSAVAEHGARLPGATIQARPLTVVVVYGWIIAGLVAGRPRFTALATAAVVAVASLAAQPTPRHPAIDPATARTHVVSTEDDVEPVPEGTEVVVVLESGRAPPRPVVTAGGIPVVYPNRGATGGG
ncbi:ComEC/Rec2 family competence protein [Corynebacterium sp.]|uniref:ComEC/Rec2 family competence protein n=1 Tax=Corynebacterium sp. TaxID=1720 RepID=UPI002A912133|nr:ComEC/Rec2 family competence protein [Corynebacterium sp.]MDY5784862.1 ComEC/Rec2 family competence protein [Corynebacterium sp.]